MATYHVIDLKTGSVLTGQTIEQAEQLTGMDAYDIEWAIENHGIAETDRHEIEEE